MKFVFFGTPHFAAIILENLIKRGSIPTALVTNPDSPVGRKKIITPPETKSLIQKIGFNIPIFQPEKIDADFLEKLKELKADVFIVAAYGKILPQTLLDIPKYGAVNIHPSLLPKYRGASPIQTAILNGETETGITLFKIDAEMDHGPIFMSKKIGIGPEDNTPSMFERIAPIAADMIVNSLLPNLDRLTPVEQNENEATYTKKFATSDGYIEYADIKKAETSDPSRQGFTETDSELAKILDRKIRALYPEPGCWIMKNNIRIKLLDSEIKNGLLKLKVIQKEGKKPTVL